LSSRGGGWRVKEVLGGVYQGGEKKKKKKPGKRFISWRNGRGGLLLVRGPTKTDDQKA